MIGAWKHEGEILPRGYGVAWYSPWTNQAYCLPIPLNRIAGGFRAWWFQLRRPCEDDPVYACARYNYERGYQAGLDRGVERGMRAAKIIFEESALTRTTKGAR